MCTSVSMCFHNHFNHRLNQAFNHRFIQRAVFAFKIQVGVNKSFVELNVNNLRKIITLNWIGESLSVKAFTHYKAQALM